MCASCTYECLSYVFHSVVIACHGFEFALTKDVMNVETCLIMSWKLMLNIREHLKASQGLCMFEGSAFESYAGEGELSLGMNACPNNLSVVSNLSNASIDFEDWLEACFFAMRGSSSSQLK